MMLFLLGLIIGMLIGSWSLHSYKKCLKMTAETTQSEYILGEWYRIEKESR